MKNKFLIAVIIIIVLIIGIYIFVKNQSVQAPAIQEQAQNENPPTVDTQTIMREMSGEEMMSHEQTTVGEKISKHIVNYTDRGFNPSSLEIKKGEIVQFVNQSGGGMWVASGPHPTHTIYPEFDAKRSVPNGGIYEFTFMKVGAWSYHNHAGPEKSGTIIVK